MARILVIDDVVHTRATIAHILDATHEIIRYTRGTLAGDRVLDVNPDIVLLSLDLPDVDAMKLVSVIAGRMGAPPIIAVSAAGDPRQIITAIRAGAFDVVVRPLDVAEVRSVCLRAMEIRAGAALPEDDTALTHLVGASPAMRRLRAVIGRVARSDAPVLIVGESGVGKELVAQAVHRLSRRSDGPFQARNCGALPEPLFESEMFGTERGAYTGAIQRPGAFEMAGGGTLFLDEVGELAAGNQVKLLRVLENRRFYRVGGIKERTADTRIIAATNRDLRRLLKLGFREDLYYRLNVLQIAIPPLRQRREDIPVLVRHFSREVDVALPEMSFTLDALARLSDYDWPGNIRELRNVVHRAAVCAERVPVRGEDIQFG